MSVPASYHGERIAVLLKERLGVKTQPVITGQLSLGDIRHGYADMTAIHKQLGFVTEISLSRGWIGLLHG